MGWEEQGCLGDFCFLQQALLHRNPGEWRACLTISFLEVKGQPSGDNSLDLGPLRRWVAPQHTLYGFFTKPRSIVFERLSPVAEPEG